MTVNFALRDWIDWNFRTQNFAGDRQAVEALMALYPIQNDTTPLPPFSKYQLLFSSKVRKWLAILCIALLLENSNCAKKTFEHVS